MTKRLEAEISELREYLRRPEQRVTAADPVYRHLTAFENIWREALRLAKGDRGDALYIAEKAVLSSHQIGEETREQYLRRLDGIPSRVFGLGNPYIGVDKPQHFFRLARESYDVNEPYARRIGRLYEAKDWVEQKLFGKNSGGYDYGDIHADDLGAEFGATLARRYKNVEACFRSTGDNIRDFTRLPGMPRETVEPRSAEPRYHLIAPKEGPRLTGPARLGKEGPRLIGHARPEAGTGGFLTHTIQAGDRVWNLAPQYGFSDPREFTRRVAEANPGIDFKRLRVGQKVVFPTAMNPGPSLTGTHLTGRIRGGDFSFRLQTPELGVSLPSLIGGHRLGSAAAAPSFLTHTIRGGERVWNLAGQYGFENRRHFTDLVAQANPGIDFRRLRVGQKINIPIAANLSPARSDIDLTDHIGSSDFSKQFRLQTPELGASLPSLIGGHRLGSA